MNYRLLILVLGTFIIGTDDFVIAGLLPSIATLLRRHPFVSLIPRIIFEAFLHKTFAHADESMI